MESDIHKLCSGFEIVIFNLSEFLADVEESIEMDDKIGLYNLKSRCTIFVSFMKGWGKDCAQISIFWQKSLLILNSLNEKLVL